jgi:hypothetical protein
VTLADPACLACLMFEDGDPDARTAAARSRGAGSARRAATTRCWSAKRGPPTSA